MKKRISIALVLTFVIGLVPAVAKARLVACVGDSVTYVLPGAISHDTAKFR
jgi:hypothetical protein